MSRYIDADALKKQWTIASPEPFSTDAAEVIDSIDNAPTVDAVEVVRCLDCKHHRVLLGRDMCAKNAVVFDGNESGLKITGENDYCSYGEREETK